MEGDGRKLVRQPAAASESLKQHRRCPAFTCLAVGDTVSSQNQQEPSILVTTGPLRALTFFARSDS